MPYDGNLISELGVKKYLKGNRALGTSNIKYFDRGEVLERRWRDCSFGCHGPSYRSLRPDATWSQTLIILNNIDPRLAGFADGVRHQTVQKIATTAAGVERTAEGLHLNGSEKFALVGAENWATADIITTVFTKVLATDISSMLNPLMQMVVFIVNEYVAAVPEWVINTAMEDGALKFPEGIDKQSLFSAAKENVFNNISSAELDEAADLLERPISRLAAKQLGKAATRALAAAISVHIAKKIMSRPAVTMSTKRTLAGLRRHASSANGGLAGALKILLTTQGLLGTAAKSSRKLKHDCPQTWQALRYRMNGCDMLYFLVAGVLKEYVDRLSLLEKRPDEFVKVMAALISARESKAVFFPGGL